MLRPSDDRIKTKDAEVMEEVQRIDEHLRSLKLEDVSSRVCSSLGALQYAVLNNGKGNEVMVRVAQDNGEVFASPTGKLWTKPAWSNTVRSFKRTSSFTNVSSPFRNAISLVSGLREVVSRPVIALVCYACYRWQREWSKQTPVDTSRLLHQIPRCNLSDLTTAMKEIEEATRPEDASKYSYGPSQNSSQLMTTGTRKYRDPGRASAPLQGILKFEFKDTTDEKRPDTQFTDGNATTEKALEELRAHLDSESHRLLPSLQLILVAETKASDFFENCFYIGAYREDDGPDAARGDVWAYLKKQEGKDKGPIMSLEASVDENGVGTKTYRSSSRLEIDKIAFHPAFDGVANWNELYALIKYYWLLVAQKRGVSRHGIPVNQTFVDRMRSFIRKAAKADVSTQTAPEEDVDSIVPNDDAHQTSPEKPQQESSEGSTNQERRESDISRPSMQDMINDRQRVSPANADEKDSQDESQNEATSSDTDMLSVNGSTHDLPDTSRPLSHSPPSSPENDRDTKRSNIGADLSERGRRYSENTEQLVHDVVRHAILRQTSNSNRAVGPSSRRQDLQRQLDHHENRVVALKAELAELDEET